MGSQPIGRVHLTEGIFPLYMALSSTQARISAFHAEEPRSTPGRVTNMGLGTAWGGRLPCKEDIQVDSISTRSTIGE